MMLGHQALMVPILEWLRVFASSRDNQQTAPNAGAAPPPPAPLLHDQQPLWIPRWQVCSESGKPWSWLTAVVILGA